MGRRQILIATFPRHPGRGVAESRDLRAATLPLAPGSRLERLTARAEREAERLAGDVPSEELAVMRATCAENRQIFAETRAALLAPSRTPALDRLVGEARRRVRRA